jgi:hypothetical protein
MGDGAATSESGDRRSGERGKSAEAELPHAGERREVGDARVAGGEVQAVGDRRHGHGDEDACHQAEPRHGHDLADHDRQAEQERQGRVELLLDRQAPEVLGRRRHVLGGQVVDGVSGQLPVLHVARGGDDLGEELVPQASRDDQHDGHGGDQQSQQ